MKRKSYILEGAGIIIFMFMFFFVLLPNIGSSKVRRVQSPIAFKESGGTRSYLHELIFPVGSTSDTGSAGWRAVTLNYNSAGGWSYVAADGMTTTAYHVNCQKYYWADDFDDEAATVQLESSLNADFWTTAGTNYAAANVTYTAGVGGTLEADTAGADNDSVNILGLANFAVNSNPILEARVKIDDPNSALESGYIAIGFVEGAYTDKASPDDDIAVVGVDTDTNTSLFLYTNDNNGGLVSDNLGVTLSGDTYIIIKLDLTDTEQPRVWIDNTEISSDLIDGTVQAGTTLMPYIMIQSLADGADTLTIDYIRCWQDRG